MANKSRLNNENASASFGFISEKAKWIAGRWMEWGQGHIRSRKFVPLTYNITCKGKPSGFAWIVNENTSDLNSSLWNNGHNLNECIILPLHRLQHDQFILSHVTVPSQRKIMFVTIIFKKSGQHNWQCAKRNCNIFRETNFLWLLFIRCISTSKSRATL